MALGVSQGLTGFYGCMLLSDAVLSVFPECWEFLVVFWGFGFLGGGGGGSGFLGTPKILRKPKPAHGREKQGWRDGGGKRFWWSRRRRRNGWGVLSSKELVRVSPCGKKLVPVPSVT